MCTFQLFRLLSRVERPLWSCAFSRHTAFSPRYFSRMLPTNMLLIHACKNTAGGGLIVEMQQAPISPWSGVQFCMLIYQHPENYHEGKNKGICHLNESTTLHGLHPVPFRLPLILLPAHRSQRQGRSTVLDKCLYGLYMNGNEIT